MLEQRVIQPFRRIHVGDKFRSNKTVFEHVFDKSCISRDNAKGAQDIEEDK